MVRGRDGAISAAPPIDDAEAAELFSPWEAATAVVIAVSGGPDSVALLGLAARWRLAGGGARLMSATFDHGLRPESAREARAVAAFSERLGVNHRTLLWEGEKPTTRVQERAREARYDALARHAIENEASHVAVAHHQGDQAETVLIRIAAGSGVGGLAGMSKVSWRNGVAIHRPLLDVTKDRLVATCRARGWLFVEDPSNENDRFARARWRALTPALAAEGLTEKRLIMLASRVRRAEAAIEGMVDAWMEADHWRIEDDGLIVDAQSWAAAAAEVRTRALSRFIRKTAETYGVAGAPERLERLERLEAQIAAAVAAAQPLTRNLRGVLVSFDGEATLVFAPEPPRRQTARSS
ncbi:MAG: tRNA lysidine(34) synthetase TilS [Rhizobiales bacterium 65-9]|nr:MAG: tRNA lysidine(34) synthetase TilS [Rhizobiales bacterium 65-9]